MTNESRRRRALTPTFTRFEKVGDSITGRYVGVEDAVNQDGEPMKRFIVDDESRGLLSFLGATQINDAMSDLESGKYVEIIYKGEEKTGNNRNRIKQFEVYELDPPDEDGDETDTG